MASFGIEYDPAIIRRVGAQLPAEQRDEMAIPSYLHRNPLVRFIVHWRMRTVLRMIGLQPGRTILDFGCGTGIMLLQLPQEFGSYVGVDVDTRVAQQVLREHGRTDVRLVEAADLDNTIHDGTIDCIVGLEVLEHVADLQAVLQQLCRKLKPGGLLVVSGPTENRIYQLSRKVAGFSGAYHVRTIRDIMRAIGAEGLRKLRSRYLPLWPPADLFIVTAYRLPPVPERG